jgi:hypothetical protein
VGLALDARIDLVELHRLQAVIYRQT